MRYVSNLVIVRERQDDEDIETRTGILYSRFLFKILLFCFISVEVRYKILYVFIAMFYTQYVGHYLVRLLYPT